MIKQTMTLALAAAITVSGAQSRRPLASRAIPEMERLGALFVGEWSTSEQIERSEFFPLGGSRSGSARWRMTVDRTALTGEGQCTRMPAAIQAGIGASKREIVTKAGHLVQMEQPERFNTIVGAFLDGLR